jgi:hypothetical protein
LITFACTEQFDSDPNSDFPVNSRFRAVMGQFSRFCVRKFPGFEQKIPGSLRFGNCLVSILFHYVFGNQFDASGRVF